MACILIKTTIPNRNLLTKQTSTNSCLKIYIASVHENLGSTLGAVVFNALKTHSLYIPNPKMYSKRIWKPLSTPNKT